MKLPEIIMKSNELIAQSNECYVAVVQEDGYPHTATRSFCTTGDIFTSYISTNLSGNLAQTLLKNTKMSICVHRDNDNITMIGEGKIVENIDVKERMWQDWFINHYPGGVYDKEYCVVEFTSLRLSLWVDRNIVKVSTADIKKPQSMCGLMCDTCDFRESHNCSGCIMNSGKPFWGECPVAKCCIDKGYSNCGECPDMPCALLNEFSCGEGEHCDNPKGARIEILKIWNK